ncbi:acylglycerol kinase family protein [Phenylobacterium sp. LjRoot219]|uniref:diacylglycerol/lipid kinase family protein n=1 Tax=Phenylobacterium sp. LjRoot219 TaxID=3342283 RepID=UPI003ECE5E50
MNRVGVIHNPRSRRNSSAADPPPRPPESVLVEAPHSHDELDAVLARFAQQGIDLLVVDGGDGTVRDVMTQAATHFTDGMPTMAVLPSGKTNALALDLGAPRDWPLEAALESARKGRTRPRRPLEVARAGETTPLARGFIFGAGAFVRATDLAQRTHKMGAFEGLAVGLTLGAATFQTLFGGRHSGWRDGEPMRLGFAGQPPKPADVFLILASTLERLPLDVQPFGPPKSGGPLRSLTVRAPPKRLLNALPIVLSGADAPWLESAGYQRRALEHFEVALETSFVLDGEVYAGGQLDVRAGAPVEFVVP